LSPWLKGFCQL
jgi:hypothetical protein